jgi:hypothetical protein
VHTCDAALPPSAPHAVLQPHALHCTVPRRHDLTAARHTPNKAGGYVWWTPWVHRKAGPRERRRAVKAVAEAHDAHLAAAGTLELFDLEV